MRRLSIAMAVILLLCANWLFLMPLLSRHLPPEAALWMILIISAPTLSVPILRPAAR